MPRRISSWSRSCLVGLALLFAPLPALAHSPIKGANDFINGALHPATTPTHILLLIGLGLMAGRRVPLNLKPRLAIFAVCAAAALAFTTTAWRFTVPPWLLVGIAMVPGILLALEKDLPLPLDYGLVALAALSLGMDSGTDVDTSGSVLKLLLGTWLSLNVLFADVALYVSFAGQAKWLKILLRIAGSWMTAIAMLMLAFALRK